MERTVSFVYSFYLNGNYKYKIRLVCNVGGRTIFCNVWFSAIHNLEHLIYELESDIQDTNISGKEERVQILDLKNPKLQDFLSVSTIIEVVGQKVLANALSSFLAFLGNRRFKKNIYSMLIVITLDSK